MHHLDLGPRLRRQPAPQLAAAETADGHHEGGLLDLAREVEELGLVEFLGAVDGEAVARAAQLVGEQGHLGSVGAEVRVHVLHALALQPVDERARLDEVDQVIRPTAFGLPRQAPRGAQRLPGPRGVRDAPPGRIQQQSRAALTQDVARLLALGQVLRTLDIGVPASHCESQHLDALALQRKNLAADERVADLRVLVDQVGDPQTALPWPCPPARALRSSISAVARAFPTTSERICHLRRNSRKPASPYRGAPFSALFR